MEICRECGSRGMKVLPLTLGVHVKEIYWDKIDDNFYFCPSESCDVVYFNNKSGVYFRKLDVKTRVGIKEREEPKPICYCNRVTEKSLLEAMEKFGFDKALEKTKAGRGKWCVVTNPSGRCCEWYLRRYGKMKKEGGEFGMKVKLELFGLSCDGCIGVVKAALENAGAKVNKITLNEAEIEIEEDVEKYLKAVRDAGYGAKLKV